jgi:hypothetical protein
MSCLSPRAIPTGLLKGNLQIDARMTCLLFETSLCGFGDAVDDDLREAIW